MSGKIIIIGGGVGKVSVAKLLELGKSNGTGEAEDRSCERCKDYMLQSKNCLHNYPDGDGCDNFTPKEEPHE